MRRGVTVIEVLFSMGIALAGLVGIASLLLLAGRQASDSNRSMEAQAFAHKWYADFVTRGMNNSTQWYWCDDSTAPPTLRSFSKSLANAYPSKGSTTIYRRELGREAVCLDPFFFAGRDINNLPNDTGWYRPSVFPYYADRYNPLLDPAYTAGIPGAQWEDQPRMLRVTWGYQTAAGVQPFTSRMLEQVFGSEDDLSTVSDDRDRSLPPNRVGEIFSSATPTVVARYSAKNEYSWLATLSPNEPRNYQTTETDLYTLSLVVIKNRDRVYLPGSMTARVAGAPPVKDQAPQGERVVWVQPLSGNFIGGSGGQVRLVGTDGVPPGVNMGDWIMLGMHVDAEALPTAPMVRPNSVFRWYRVVSIDDEEILNAMPDPYATPPFTNSLPSEHTVWAQNVTLDGPDWVFPGTLNLTTLGGPVQMRRLTTGTLVKGAVSVYERVVSIPN